VKAQLIARVANWKMQEEKTEKAKP